MNIIAETFEIEATFSLCFALVSQPVFYAYILKYLKISDASALLSYYSVLYIDLICFKCLYRTRQSMDHSQFKNYEGKETKSLNLCLMHIPRYYLLTYLIYFQIPVTMTFI